MKNPFIGIYRYREKGKEKTFRTPPFFAKSFTAAKENIYRAARELFRDVELLSLSIRQLPNPRRKR